MKLPFLAFLCLAQSVGAATYMRRDYSCEVFAQRIGIQQQEYRLGAPPMGTWFEIYLGPAGSLSCSSEVLALTISGFGVLALSAFAYRRFNTHASRNA